MLTAYVKKWTTNVRREEKVEGAAEFGRKKKQQNSQHGLVLWYQHKNIELQKKVIL